VAGDYSYKALAGWTGTVDIFELDNLLIPINVKNNQHLIAVMMSMTEKYIHLYDPEGGKQILQFLRDEHHNKE
jgi:Ulp1 family protease